VTSGILKDMGIVDGTIEEPKGGAHRDVDLMSERIKAHIATELTVLEQLPVEDMLAKRYQRLMSYGN
jgi:acetyl-CoA carboxylase carboxyl transferase subunit alpha